jgi:hypothetical protein
VQTIALALMVYFVRSKTFSGWLVCFLTIGSLYGAWRACSTVVPSSVSLVSKGRSFFRLKCVVVYWSDLYVCALMGCLRAILKEPIHAGHVFVCVLACIFEPGGGFGVLPAFVSDLWGSKISGATHGITIGVWALSTIIGVPVFTSIVKGNSIKSATGASVPQPEGLCLSLDEVFRFEMLATCLGVGGGGGICRLVGMRAGNRA